jgi:alkanesulfonate monooxygenase SsuD/methylene tetrahydromethanopterin reductase-like flavin-dependent oxidoreductase (luciferase family)
MLEDWESKCPALFKMHGQGWQLRSEIERLQRVYGLRLEWDGQELKADMPPGAPDEVADRILDLIDQHYAEMVDLVGQQQ